MNQPACDRSATTTLPEHRHALTLMPQISPSAGESAEPCRQVTCSTLRLRYRELLDLLPDVYLLTDPYGVIAEASASVSALFGTARSFVIGKPFSAYVFADDRAGLNAKLRGLGESRRRPVLWQGRLRSRRQHEELQVAVHIRPITAADGEVISFQWLIRDVTAALAQADRLLTLEREIESRVRSRTAELEAVVRIQATQLASAQPGR